MLSPGSSISTDVVRFEALMRAPSEPDLRQAVSLADGEFLSGIEVPEPPWEEWLSGDALAALGEIEYQSGEATAGTRTWRSWHPSGFPARRCASIFDAIAGET